MPPPVVPDSLKGLFSRRLLPQNLGAPLPEDDNTFPHPLDSNCRFQRPLTTERELTMRRIVDAITDKLEWASKVREPAPNITQKWFWELASSNFLDVSGKMIRYLSEELRYIAELFDETGFVSVYDGNIVKSDTAIPEALKTALQAAAARLEDVPESEKDWHPHSDEQVLDLVHPSLFPVVFGLTRVVPDVELSIEEGLRKLGSGEVLPRLSDRSWQDETTRYSGYYGSYQYSHNYQWLPCEVKFRPTKEVIDDEGKEGFRCRITSYINNLHPSDNRELYGIIEQVLTRTIPLWNATLSPLYGNKKASARIEYEEVTYTIDPENIPEDLKLNRGDDEPSYDSEQEWEETLHKVTLILPEPGKFQRPKNCAHCEDVPPVFKLEEKFAEQGLQVIVKMANIHLTPEKPEYRGGTWHIEGQLNERICATALYYYDSHNITDSRLAFRQSYNADDISHIEYLQDHRFWLKRVFGVEEEQPCVQDVGTITCKEGRLLTFPNIFQHQVQPFQLQDPSKPGHRKILALFLVDPNVRILSSANVPVQRKDWRMAPTWEALHRLPIELKMMVEKFADDDNPLVNIEKAKAIREGLMEERKAFNLTDQQSWTQTNVISLCEH